MRTEPRFLLLLPLAALLACGSSATPATQSLDGNWEVQGVMSGALLLNGAIQGQGSQYTGTFANADIPCSPPVINFTGTVDSAGDLNLTSNFVQLSLPTVAPSDPQENAVGTLSGGGYLCQTTFSTPITGTLIAPLTGTYSGTTIETASTLVSPIPTATISLALIQSAAPNTNGQFPVSGSLTFTGGGCSQLIQVGGTVNGVGVALVSIGSNAVTIAAATNPAASQIIPNSILFSPAPCASGNSSSTYAGVLTLQ